MRRVAVVAIVLSLGGLAAAGAGSLAQEPPTVPPFPTATTAGPTPPATTAPPQTPVPPVTTALPETPAPPVTAATPAQAPPPAAFIPATPPPAAPPTPAPAPATAPPVPARPSLRRPAAVPSRRSVAVGQPWNGRLVDGVQLPEVSADWLTWDPVRKQIPNRPWRRWGTAKLLATIARVLASFHAAHPELPQVLIGDLSRPHGGIFDNRFGGLGHASHQNGLDADIYYPRADRRLRAAFRPDQVDRALAQDLLNRFLAEHVQFVFVGTRVGLRGPRKVVDVLAHHNDHMHVRIFPPRS